MRKSNWILPPDGDLMAENSLAAKLGVTGVTAKLLVRRGITEPTAADAFFSHDVGVFRDPFEMADMEKAVSRILKAVRDGEKILIYGDYDVDGVTSVSILYLYLTAMGGKVRYYIPDRLSEGYGVNAAAIRRLSEDTLDLMITVDTGITAFDEVLYAADLGIDTVITDHHSCRGDLPAAVAVVNPMREDCSYPFPQLAGVGVVFKLLCAIECSIHPEEVPAAVYERLMRLYGDLVAIGTVADVMPLTDENRYIVAAGLAVGSADPRPGLAALLDAAQGADKAGKSPRKPLTAGTVSFVIAPRINAAGRMDTATKAVELFLTRDPGTAAKIAEELCALNRLRQEEENKILTQAEALIAASRRPEDRILVLAGDGWHHGVIGIVSSRITERYHLPSILISFDGETGKGSGRSISGMSLMAALQDSQDLLIQYGGHELAAGLSVRRDQLEAFKARIGAYAAEALPQLGGDAPVKIDAILSPEEVTLRQAEELLRFEPFGIANPQPLFITEGLTVASVVPLSGGKHVKLLLSVGDGFLTALWFNRSPAELGCMAGDRISLLYQLSVNEFRGTSSAQMLLRDLLFDEADIIEAEEREYACLIGEESYLPDIDFFPTREDFIAVYRRLRQTVSDEMPRICCRTFRPTDAFGREIPYLKRRVVLDVLAELGILSLEDPAEAPYRVKVRIHQLENKIKFEKSALYKRLRQKSPRRE